MKEKKGFERLVEMTDCLVDKCDENESAFAMCCNDDGKFHYASYCSVNDMAAATASILSDFFDDGNEKTSSVARGIVKGLCVYIENEGKGSLEIAARLAAACSKVMEKKRKNLMESMKELIDKMGDGNDANDNDDDEDCETCDNVKDCPLPQAIKYRKENHIPAPKGKKKAKKEKGN